MSTSAECDDPDYDRKTDIDTMALKHFSRHPNDKSGATLAKMHRRFGHHDTMKSLLRVSSTCCMIYPEFEKEYKKHAIRGELVLEHFLLNDAVLPEPPPTNY